jgi:DNA-nicking Smr family endonuclease
LKRPTGSARRRGLSDEDIDLWLAVAATVTQRRGAVLPVAVALKPRPKAATAESSPAPARSMTRPAPVLTGLERKLKRKLARGRMSADAAIDLHGFRQADAHRTLLTFLSNAQRDGARLVLVVTGKGGRGGSAFDIAGGDVGVLKRSVPLWLASPPFRVLVSGFEEAAPVHGGSGALYIRLRRRV